MIAVIRLFVFGFIGLSVLYLLLSVYSRSLRREKLEKKWDANPPEGQGKTERSAYIRSGMIEYEQGLRKKLIVLVFVIPIIVFGVTVYFVNIR